MAAAAAPMISEICGMTPEAWMLLWKIRLYRPSETTPSWMRAPAPSLMPMSGRPVLRARSCTLTIFSPYTSPRLPPNTVTSWLKMHTSRPSMVP